MPEPGPSALPLLDETAFERWIDAFRGPLVGMLASSCGEWRTAEELAHDTFAEAWLGRTRFQGDPADLAAAGRWLRGIAFHLGSAWLRAHPGRATVAEAALGPDGLDGLARDARRAGVEAEPSGRVAILRDEFSRLAPDDQTLLRMHYLERTTAREVAALLGKTPKAVENRLYSIRRGLWDRIVRAEHRAQREAER